MSNAQVDSGSANVETIYPSRHRRKRRILLLIVPAVVLLAAGIIYLLGGRYVETDNAYVKADMVPISADVSGTIKAVMVKENQTVTAGQPLFRIDPASFRIAVDHAAANLAQVRSDLQALQASYREKEAEITLQQTRQAFAIREWKRQSNLADKHFASTSTLDDAKQNADVATQQLAALGLDLQRIAVALGGSVATPVEQLPSYQAAQAELAQAKLDLARVVVRAPVAGTVSKLPKPGQYLTAGNTALALVASANQWVEANFTETDLTHVQPGQPVSIHIDTYPGQVWQGVVDSLSPATGAEFSVIPAQNATGNWVKIVQRVPVRIRLEQRQGLPALRAGLSAVAEIDTGHHHSLLGFSL